MNHGKDSTWKMNVRMADNDVCTLTIRKLLWDFPKSKRPWKIPLSLPGSLQNEPGYEFPL